MDRIDHQDQEIEVEIEIEEIVEGVVMIGMIGIVEVLVNHQIEVVMIEENYRDRYRYDSRDRYKKV